MLTLQVHTTMMTRAAMQGVCTRFTVRHERMIILRFVSASRTHLYNEDLAAALSVERKAYHYSRPGASLHLCIAIDSDLRPLNTEHY